MYSRNAQGLQGVTSNRSFCYYCQSWLQYYPPPPNNAVVRFFPVITLKITPLQPPTTLLDGAYHQRVFYSREVPLLQENLFPTYAPRSGLPPIEMLPNRPTQSPNGVIYWPALPQVPRPSVVPSGRYEEESRPPVPQMHQGYVPYEMPAQNGGSPATYGYGINADQTYPLQDQQRHPGYGVQNLNQWPYVSEFVPVQNNGQEYEFMVQPPVTSEAPNGIQWSPGHEFVPSQSPSPNGRYLYEPQSVPSFVQGASTSQMPNECPWSPSQQFASEENGGQFAPAYNMVPPQQYWVFPQDPRYNGGPQSSQGGWWGAH